MRRKERKGIDLKCDCHKRGKKREFLLGMGRRLEAG